MLLVPKWSDTELFCFINCFCVSYLYIYCTIPGSIMESVFESNTSSWLRSFLSHEKNRRCIILSILLYFQKIVDQYLKVNSQPEIKLKRATLEVTQHSKWLLLGGYPVVVIMKIELCSLKCVFMDQLTLKKYSSKCG